MEHKTEETPAAPDRRNGVERRTADRRVASQQLASGVERRTSERRSASRRAIDVPPLFCPDCLGPLQYDAGLSWSMPGIYTVDTGYCPSCARRFLRNRATGDYDALSL